MIDIIKKYFELIETGEFHEYSFDFAEKINNAILNNYSNNEPYIVRKIVKEINNNNKLSLSINGMSISTDAIFIHGNNSQVEFKYRNTDIQKELGDLIFILSIIYQGKKQIEKFTISQTKKAQSKPERWEIDKKQLFLLSHFPSFKGVKGIIPKEKIKLKNFSGTLGSYSLLEHDDFIYISAPLLRKVL